VQHAVPVCVGFLDGSPVNEKLGSFRHFPHRLPNGFVPQSRAAKETPKMRTSHDCPSLALAMLPWPRNGSRLLIMKWLIPNWVRFAIFRIGCQMASFRKLRAAKATPKLRMIARLSFTGVAMFTVASRWQQATDYEVVNHKLDSFRHFLHRLPNGFVP
jgi:hypothetical protein